MEKSHQHIIMVAGEASGDMHAASLVNHLRALEPRLTFSGLGGRQMEHSGVKLYWPLADSGVVGFTEVIGHLPTIRRVFSLVLNKVREMNAKTVILIDYPGFNLRLAKALKKQGIKIIYYISPQVWAWKENRVKLIKQYTDKMIVFFPFEKTFYEKYGLDVTYVGHPLLDQIHIKKSREQFLESAGLSTNKITLGLLPGSRRKEVERLFPVMLKAASLLSQEFPSVQLAVLRSPTIEESFLRQFLDSCPLSVKVISQDYYEALNAMDICLVASGTATLETAVLQKPMVIVYKTSFLTWLLARLFIKIPCIGLVNVVAQKKIVPELIQFDASAANIHQTLKRILTDELYSAQIRADLKEVKDKLGTPGASRRAAEAVINFLA